MSQTFLLVDYTHSDGDVVSGKTLHSNWISIHQNNLEGVIAQEEICFYS